MTIESYTVEQLGALLEEKHFWFQNVSPVTRHRAQLLVHNPRSQPDDAVLFVARENGEIIGYRIIFPDVLYFNGECRRIGWGSSFWVDGRYRGKGVGRLLFQRSLECWGGNIGSLIQSRDAARVYERDETFYCFNDKEGYQIVLRLNALYWLRKRIGIPSWLGWIFAPANFLVNGVLSPFRAAWVSRKKPMNGFLVEYCREIIDRETIDFVKKHNQGTLTRKTVEDLNNIVRYPTSMATPLEDAIASRYYFATRASRFDYLYFKVFDLKLNLKAVVLLNVDGEALRLLYYFYESDEFLQDLFDIVLLHAYRLKTEIIVSYDAQFNQHVLKNSGFPRLFSRRQVRKSFMPVSYRQFDLQRFATYDGDGA